MRSTKKIFAIITVCIICIGALISLVGCIPLLPPLNSGNGNTGSSPSMGGSGPSGSEYPRPDPSQEDTRPRYSGQDDIIVDFSQGLNNSFVAANGYCNGGVFDTYWLKNNVVYNKADQTIHLSLKQDSRYAASGAEYRSWQKYGYGYFSVKMQPVKKVGVVSSFFTYTGPSDGTKWDEIDIEFLGKDTTKVQFNYFSNSNGGHEHIYDLGFDASLELHEYGFLWTQNSITWFVDGIGVYTATQDIPTTPGRIMINVWVGNASDSGIVNWLGKFDGAFPVDDAKYQWIGFKSI